MRILGGKQDNANAFLEAAIRCSWSRVKKDGNHMLISRENKPLLVPEMVNMALACELYIKAIADATKVDFAKLHNLDELFKKLERKDRKAIFDIWRETAGTNIIDCDYTRQMFSNNLEAAADVFIKFRYTDEWVGNTISLQSSFTPKQFAKLSPACGNPLNPRPPIYEGFLEQFAKSLKTHIEKLVGRIYNS